MARSRNLGYGEGSVYQEADGRWRGELRIGTKRRRVSGATRADVVKELDKVRAKLSAGLPLEDNVRLGEWLDWYREVVVAVQDPSTRHNGAWAIRQLEPLRGRRLRELGVIEFEDLLNDLSTRDPSTTRGRGGRSKPLTKSSLNRIKMVLGAALHEAERRGLVARNIARLAHLPPSVSGPRPRRSLTLDEAQKFLEAIQRTSSEALLLTPLMLGLRPGEVLGLPWNAVNLDDATMEIRQSLKRLPDGQHVIAPPKVNSYRKVRIPEQLVGVLRAHRLRQRKEQLSAEVWEDNGFVFPNAIGRHMDFSNFRRITRHYAHIAQIGPLAPNELRHSAASLLVASGTPLQDVSDLLGHRDIRMLAQTYRHKIQSVVDVTNGQNRMLSG